MAPAGNRILSVWDPSSPTLIGLREIAAYPFDPDWIIDAEYRSAPGGRVTEVTRLTSPPSKDSMPVAADLVFDIAGKQHTLLAFKTFTSELLVVFTDCTSGIDTPRIGRWLILPQAATSTVRIDFNQAVLPHHVFSPLHPCPLPPAGNHLPLRVEAGERVAVFDDTTVPATAGPTLYT